MDAYGRIDAVANNTGFPPKGPLLEIPDEDWHDGLDMVLMNVIRMARLVTPIMAGQGGGAIVNISTTPPSSRARPIRSPRPSGPGSPPSPSSTRIATHPTASA